MTDERLIELLAPYLPAGTPTLPPEAVAQLQAYLGLLTRWNERTNLTAIRDPETMVARHFGESLFAASVVSPPLLPPRATLLDFGSGAGFPGLPIQLCRPDLNVTLAESQNKKATFLREVVRTLDLRTTVHAARAETLPPGTTFDCVIMRAVDKMNAAVPAALAHVHPSGHLVLLTTAEQAVPASIRLQASYRIPRTQHSVVQVYSTQSATV